MENQATALVQYTFCTSLFYCTKTHCNRKTTLEKCEKELTTLAATVENRKLKAALSEAKGAAADQVTAVIAELNNISAALAELVRQTGNAVAHTRVGFTEMDAELAKWFGITEE